MPSQALPSLFISHGAPTIVEGTGGTAAFLRSLGGHIPRPRAVLVVTAHWETVVPTIGTAAAPATMHDFHGFPPHFYELSYPAPGAVALAADVIASLRAAGIDYALDHNRGYDHGTWVPLMLMYPDASIPVAQLSIQPAAGLEHHLAVGRALAGLRAGGVLVLGSGGAVHNVSQWIPAVPEWARTFEAWLASVVERGAANELLNYRQLQPDAALAHPREEHLLPLLVAMGAGGGSGRVLHREFDGSLGLAAFAFEGGGHEDTRPIHRKGRLRRDERERMIIDEAVAFFCKHGVDGQTRALADRMGITQPLLYRYFPDKHTLVERAFEEVFSRRWSSEWRVQLSDRSVPLDERVSSFAVSYCLALLEDGWIRLILSAGLKGGGLDRRFLTAVREEVVLPLCRELRHDVGLPEQAPNELEQELVWTLHDSLFGIAQRNWLHGLGKPLDIEGVATTLSLAVLSGARTALLTTGTDRPGCRNRLN